MQIAQDTTAVVLVALFSNATALNGAGDSFARAYLTYKSPVNATTGIRDPKSAADHAAEADFVMTMTMMDYVGRSALLATERVVCSVLFVIVIVVYGCCIS